MFGFTPSMRAGLSAAGLQLLMNNGKGDNIAGPMMSAMNAAKGREAEAERARLLAEHREREMAFEKEKFEHKKSQDNKATAFTQSELDIKNKRLKFEENEEARKVREAEQNANMVQRLTAQGHNTFTQDNQVDPQASNAPSGNDPFKHQARIGGGEDVPVPSQDMQSKTEAKRDRHVATGDEGNDFALRMAAIPPSVRGAIHDNPLAGGKLLEKPLESAITEAYKLPEKPKDKGPDYVTIVGHRGKVSGERRTFDVNNAIQREALEKRLATGDWAKHSAGLEKLLEKPITARDESWKKTHASNWDKLQVDREKVQAYEQIASQALDDRVFKGAGADGVLAVLKIGKQVGLFQNIDIAAAEAASYSKSALFGMLRESILGPDSRLSDADREFLLKAIPGIEFSAKGLARVMAIEKNKLEFNEEKLEWLEQDIKETGNIGDSYSRWEVLAREKDSKPRKIQEKYMGEEALNKVADEYLSKKGNGEGPSIFDLVAGSGIPGTDTQKSSGTDMKRGQLPSGNTFSYRKK